MPSPNSLLRQKLTALWLVLALLYVGTMSRNHSEGEDSLFYINYIEAGYFSPHANHMLFIPQGYLTYKIWQTLGYQGHAILPLQVNNLLAAMLTLGLVFSLARRLGADVHWAISALLLTASSYGFWHYASQTEPYLLPLPWMLLAIRTLLPLVKGPFHLPRCALLGLLAGAATLCHQQHILLLPTFSLTLWLIAFQRSDHITFGRCCCCLALFIGCALSLVGAVYLGTAIWYYRFDAFEAILRWALGHGAKGLWTPLSFANPLKACIGLLHAVWGGHFLFAFEPFAQTLEQLLPGKRLMEERFLVANLSSPHLAAAMATTALSLIAGAAIFFSAISTAVGQVRRRQGQHLWPYACWALPLVAFYLTFNTLWEPHNIEFYIPLLPVFALGLAVLGTRSPKSISRRTCWLLAGSLLGANLLGSKIPLADEKADFFRMSNHQLLAHTTPGDVVLTTGYININFLKVFTPAQIIAFKRHATPADLAKARRQHSGRLFISSWLFTLDDTPDRPILPAAVSRLRDMGFKVSQRWQNSLQTIWEINSR